MQVLINISLTAVPLGKYTPTLISDMQDFVFDVRFCPIYNSDERYYYNILDERPREGKLKETKKSMRGFE